jgi:transcriptional regulator with XRE-family HTH domain
MQGFIFMSTKHVQSDNIAEHERRAFSSRLHEVLIKSSYSPDSPTQLAREFNVRYAGRSITVHASRKWLMGEAIPTQEKLRVLAQWLGVTAEWLRFGGKTVDAAADRPNDAHWINPRDLAILENLQRLDDKHRDIVHTLVRQLVHANCGT